MAFPVVVGQFPLTGVADLPNVTIAYPGEHWSNRIASAAITPGEAVIEVNIGGKLGVDVASTTAKAAELRAGIATRVIEPPDTANNSRYTTSLGPNEIKNQVINAGEYVHVYYSGVFHLTLAVPRAWVPGEYVKWNASGARPTGKTGTGSWDVTTNAAEAVYSVMEFRPFSANGFEGLLTVRSLRGQH
jgi:predicted RecA/RadA family phage recombinase